MKALRNTGLVLVLALALVVSTVAVLGRPGLAAADGPAPGTIDGVRTFTFLNARVLSGTAATTVTRSPLTIGGVDASKVSTWYAADAFVTADVGPTSTVTVTVQAGADSTNWATVTSTAAIDTDGTTLLQFPIAGEYLRYSIAYDGRITLTIKTTLKNTGGQ